MSSFEEIAAQVTNLREQLLGISREVDQIGIQLESEILPLATATFAGAESPAALRALSALAAAYQSGLGFSSAVFVAADDMRTYLVEM
ncbi:hypothetical protein SAMN04488074_10593 [Lentzea albidocapillata subsp. violacea]|uniref:Excreted virulence factor EspC, type VII ESX diderm n=1 Tax=Lentzea albidocapillata subsp. violacea TaxID=128104 RepID=A0A1G9AR09_9PSEU|nr:hypothetical protein [Lentzea albidocapillata]SDK29697.1 hypothetical protein SAMN04488074_10593 [Lentzea albidocapillata subsp. violacea]